MHFHFNVSSKSKVLRSECCQQPVDVTSKQHVTATQIFPRLTKNDCLWKVEPVTRKYSFRGTKFFKTGGYNCFNLLRNRDISFLYSNISIYLFIDTSEKLLCLQDFGKAVVRDTLTTMHVCSIKLYLYELCSPIWPLATLIALQQWLFALSCAPQCVWSLQCNIESTRFLMLVYEFIPFQQKLP